MSISHRVVAFACLGLWLAIAPAHEADAYWDQYKGRLQARYKEIYEDGDQEKDRFRVARGIVDARYASFAWVNFDSTLAMRFALEGRNDRKARVVASTPPETDHVSFQNFLSAHRGYPVEMLSYRIKDGQQRVSRDYSRNRFDARVSGKYRPLEGPRQGQVVRFVFVVEMKRGRSTTR